jgi:D-arabinose 1-dehydrogenase-like Zn-dependent alcohol dehydrogenase
MTLEEKYDHPLYKYCKDEKEADAIAWAFVNKEKFVRFPFKFPELGPKEIRANILYTGLCQTDAMICRSKWFIPKYPLAPGHEIIAEVSQVGSEVKDFKKGDLVGFGTIREICGKCKYCKQGLEELCRDADYLTYDTHWGGYATALQQPAEFFFHLPEGFDIKSAPPLFCAGITVFYPMCRYLKDGMETAVIGCGGLGHLAIKFLKSLGHHVTAFTSTSNKIEEVKKMGADDVIVSTDPEQMKKAQDKFDFVINTLPVNDKFGDYFETCARAAYFIQVGVPANDNWVLGVTASTIVIKEIKFIGSWLGPRVHINEMVKLCHEKNVYPTVEEFAFEDFPKALDKLEHGKPHFRCVVNVKDFAEKNGFKK